MIVLQTAFPQNHRQCLRVSHLGDPLLDRPSIIRFAVCLGPLSYGCFAIEAICRMSAICRNDVYCKVFVEACLPYGCLA
ncbi:hypothetical protein BO86DRAFT_32211 [Aspergillus japonicus CBS 114.51]|uniref:Uncharacterized protein n=2 Tax=Aspergillus TaxID=5052 RepID=A0A2V5HBD4_ASPV1|nr:hypothetical protein BO86DRAFT_32211 [Aspergillus japonicus CBS 114.51]PYI19652.1 hypothetical protein BO99DRAFT_134291 [Aspergillus violaceofuscus CBS 115571]RAH83709.1 hypothetical protein BO86DRAFT_32211 [Aspergillus japonicus CBS 114.51]